MTFPLGSVMFIDDEDIDQRQYRRILKRSGLAEDVLQFVYADTALEWLENNRDNWPDVIFLDVNMPRMTGFEFLGEANRRLPELNAVVVIMLTTSLEPRDRELALSYSCVQGFFNKPLNQEHLVDAARIVCAQNAPTA